MKYAMRFRKSWLRVKSVNFDFSANCQVLIIMSRISQPWSLQLIYGLRNRSLNSEFRKMSFLTFSHFLIYWKVFFLSWIMGSVKSSSTDYNKSNKPNPKSLAHIEFKKSLVELGVSQNELFHFFLHFSLYLKVYSFPLSHGFLNRITYMKVSQDRIIITRITCVNFIQFQ